MVAVILAVPDDTAVTSPDPLTVAIPAALECQASGLRARTADSAFVTVATSCCVAATSRIAVVGAIAIACGIVSGTVMTTVFDVTAGLVIVAVTLVEPGATAVTRPELLIVATDGLLECHALTLCAKTTPLVLVTTAAIC